MPRARCAWALPLMKDPIQGTPQQEKCVPELVGNLLLVVPQTISHVTSPGPALCPCWWAKGPTKAGCAASHPFF